MQVNRYASNLLVGLVLMLGLGLAAPIPVTAFEGGLVQGQKGKATVDYQKRKPSKKAKQEALRQAKANALDIYVRKHYGMAAKKTWLKKKKDAFEDIDTYVVSSRELAKDIDKKAKTLTVSISADIDKDAVDILLSDDAEGKKAKMAFVFVARKVIKKIEYDPSVTRKKDTTRSRQTNQRQERKRDASLEIYEAADNDQKRGVQKRDVDKTLSGRDIKVSEVTTQVSQKEITGTYYLYDVYSSDEINTAMTEVFTNNGYSVIPIDGLSRESRGQVDINAFIDDYKDGEDISSETRERAVAGLKELGIEFFGYGTLDVEPNPRSDVSGNMRVTATVKGQVLDLRDRFATIAASVSPQQADGEGGNETVARGNALRAAARQAAATIVHQLRSRGL